MAFLSAQNTISGQEARAQINLDGTIYDLFYAKKIDAKFNKEKIDVRTLGKRGKQKKTVGWDGTGSMTVYYVTSLFRQLAIDYIKNGRDLYFQIIVTNEDPQSAIGRQTVALHNCNLNETTLAKFDVDSQVVDEEMNFSFDDADILESFTPLP